MKRVSSKPIVGLVVFVAIILSCTTTFGNWHRSLYANHRVYMGSRIRARQQERLRRSRARVEAKRKKQLREWQLQQRIRKQRQLEQLQSYRTQLSRQAAKLWTAPMGSKEEAKAIDASWAKKQIEKKIYILTKKVCVGMTKSQVLASWGAPSQINRTVGSWGNHEQWVYRRGSYTNQYLYFENGKLTSYQTPR